MRSEVIKAITPRAGSLIPVTSFQAVSFYDEAQKRQIIVLYALGADGIVREFNGGKWQPFPIKRGETS